MTMDRDDESARRYRAANAALDERPSAATRAAILAAAARQVDAKPQAADAPPVTRRSRWPLAAAAAVLLSTLAVMMASRTEQEMPTFTAPSEKAAPASPQVAAPSAPQADVQPAPQASTPVPTVPAAAPPIAANAPTRERKESANVTAEPRAKKSAPVEPMRAAQDAAADRSIAAPSATPAPAVRAPEVASAELAATARAAPPPPVSAPATSAAAPAASAGALNESAKAEGAVASDRAARRESAPAALAAQKAQAPGGAREFERSPREWLDYIVRLRGEGRQVEADTELKRFRERYPGEAVPAAALPPAAGTR